MTFISGQMEVELNYKVKLAVDFSDELKAGDEIEMINKSLFKFQDGKIIEMVEDS